MALNVLALCVVVVALAAGCVSLWRGLPRAAVAADSSVGPACVACAWPGRLMAADSFACPGCGRDVREFGVAVLRPSAARRPFWRALWFSAGLCFVALVATPVAFSRLPRSESVRGDASYQPRAAPFRGLDVSYEGRLADDGSSLDGEIDADLVLHDGRRVTLELESPSLRYRLIDADGHETPPAAGRFDEVAVRQWLSTAGLDAAGDPAVAPLVRRIDAWVLAFAGPNPNPGALTLGDGASSSSSTGEGDQAPAYAMPAAMMLWSIVWLACVAWIVRGRRPKARALPPAAAGEAAA